MLSWLGQQCARFRSWRVARRKTRIDHFIANASLPESVARRNEEDAREYGRLELNDEGFHLVKSGVRVSAVNWQDVRMIRAFKRDFWSYDIICLAFEVGDDEWIEIWERMVGFLIVCEKMKAVFAGVPDNWYLDIMLPPSALNVRVLWQSDQPNRDADVTKDTSESATD